MKKILALVVAFVLCFTAVAGCFTATAEDAVPTITIKDATAADGGIVIPVEGTNLQSVDSYLITIVLPSDYTKIAVEGMEPAGENGGDYAVNGTSVKILNEIEKLDTDNDGAIAFNVTATVPAVEADRVDDVTATVDAGNADAQPVDVTVVPGKATLKAPAPEHTCTYGDVQYKVEDGKYITYRSCTDETCDYEDEVLASISGVTFSHSMSFESSLSLNYYFKFSTLANYADYEDFKLVVTRTKYVNKDTTNTPTVISDIEITEYTSNSNYHIFAYSDVAAKALSDEITVDLYAKKGDVWYYAYSEDYNAVSYAKDILAKSSNNYMKTLVADMLVYGAEAQTYFGYHTNKLADAILDENPAFAAYATQNIPDSFNNHEDTSKANGITWKKTVVYENSLCMKFYMDLNGTEYLNDLDNLELRVNFESVQGLSKTETYPASGFVSATSGGVNYKTQEFYGNVYGCVSKPFTAELLYKGNVVSTYEYSIESYASALVANGSASADLAASLIVYGTSCYNYLINK